MLNENQNTARATEILLSCNVFCKTFCLTMIIPVSVIVDIIIFVFNLVFPLSSEFWISDNPRHKTEIIQLRGMDQSDHEKLLSHTSFKWNSNFGVSSSPYLKFVGRKQWRERKRKNGTGRTRECNTTFLWMVVSVEFHVKCHLHCVCVCLCVSVCVCVCKREREILLQFRDESQGSYLSSFTFLVQTQHQAKFHWKQVPPRLLYFTTGPQVNNTQVFIFKPVFSQNFAEGGVVRFSINRTRLSAIFTPENSRLLPFLWKMTMRGG